MPQQTSSSKAQKRPSRPRPRPTVSRPQKKELAFGPVEVICDSTTPKSSSSRPNPPSVAPTSASRKFGGRLRRSPTPVLTSLNELTDAHLTQLSTVWQWRDDELPTFETDKRSIAATRAGKDNKPDPFDF